MGVKIRKRGGKWYIFVNYRGRRKAKCVGTSRQVAEQIRRQLEAKFALGDLGFLAEQRPQIPTFAEYTDRWLAQYAELHCKPSTVYGYRRVLDRYLLPNLGSLALPALSREQLKNLLSDLAGRGLSKNTMRNFVCTVRVILNHAIEDGYLEHNPAAKLGRFTKSDKPKFNASSLTSGEAESFLEATRGFCPDYFPLFLTALRAGLRRGGAGWSTLG